MCECLICIASLLSMSENSEPFNLRELTKSLNDALEERRKNGISERCDDPDCPDYHRRSRCQCDWCENH